MIRFSWLRSASLFVCVIGLVVVSPDFSWAQAEKQEKSPQAEKSHEPQPALVGGNWQMSWQGRLGAEDCVLHLRQNGIQLSGTLQTSHGESALSGTVHGTQIFFDVQFQGPNPYAIRFMGSAEGGGLAGTSQAIGVGGGGAYLGHGGEVVQPEHPWTAVREASKPTTASTGETSSARN